MEPLTTPTPSSPLFANVIQLTSRLKKDWSGQLIDDSSYDLLIEGRDTKVLKPDGSVLLYLRKNVLSKEALRSAWNELETVNMLTSNRGVAYGIKATNRKLQNGQLSKTKEVPKQHKVRSYILGYMDRNARQPYCRKCSWNDHHPARWEKIIPLAQEVSHVFSKSVPERYEVQNQYARDASQDFVIPGTCFTTITVNKNFRTACHKDAGDLEAGFGVITLLRKGKFRGGTLVLPDFRVGVNFDTGDVLFFDVHEFHGNTKIYATTEGFQRCTMVFYFREGIKYCGSAREEWERAKNRKLGDRLNG
jgi:2-oxoglutarate-Fe(II)-dependent dioxygenase family protein